MVKRWTAKTKIEKPDKKTSIAGKHSRVSFHSMNKTKRRSYKKYRGQGK